MKIKKISDYFEIVQEKFPNVPKEDIKRILNFGFKSLYLHNVYGGDILLYDTMVNKYLCYIGNLTYDSLKHFKYYIKKLIVKIRVYYNRNKTKWNGYYYFALTDNQYNEYLSQIKVKGRKRKYYKFPKYLMLYKIYEECKVENFNKKYFFKYPTGVDLGYKYFKTNLVTDKAEFVEQLEIRNIKTLIDNEKRSN